MGGNDITWYPSDFYHVFDEGGTQLVGYITSGWFSPTQNSNIGFAFVPVEHAKIGTKLKVALPDCYGGTVEAEVAETPFKKPHDAGTGLAQTGKKLET